jgi:hypothetical protein
MRSNGWLIAFFVFVLAAMLGLSLDPPAMCWPRSLFGPIGLVGLLGSLVTGVGLCVGLVRGRRRA